MIGYTIGAIVFTVILVAICCYDDYEPTNPELEQDDNLST